MTASPAGRIPTQMRAVVTTGNGGYDKLDYRVVPTPVPVAGEVPNPINPPTGCSFHPRCPFVTDRCRSEAPAHRAYGETMIACHGVEENRIPA